MLCWVCSGRPAAVGLQYIRIGWNPSSALQWRLCGSASVQGLHRPFRHDSAGQHQCRACIGPSVTTLLVNIDEGLHRPFSDDSAGQQRWRACIGPVSTIWWTGHRSTGARQWTIKQRHGDPRTLATDSTHSVGRSSSVTPVICPTDSSNETYASVRRLVTACTTACANVPGVSTACTTACAEVPGVSTACTTACANVPGVSTACTSDACANVPGVSTACTSDACANVCGCVHVSTVHY